MNSVEQNMQVVKRDGSREDVAFDKILARIKKAAEGLAVNPAKVTQRVVEGLIDGITTTELDTITANLSFSWSTTHPDYGELAARIAVSSHQKNTPTTMLEATERLHAIKDRTGDDASVLAPWYVEVVRANAAAIEARIDYNRDFLIDFFGFRTLEKAYLLRDSKRVVVERPQHLWMRVALGLWGNDLSNAFETYDLMSRKFYTHATPTLFNAGTKRSQMSSCFLLSMNEDSIKGIYKTLADCAAISQYAGGIGLHVSDIRAKDSLIKGTGGLSNGLVPMLRVFNNTARYVDQCFAPTTLIHTDKGLKPIASLSPGARVLTSGGAEVVEEDGKHKTGPVAPRFCAVRKLVEHAYSGRIVRICVKYKGLLSITTVTPAHPLLALRGLADKALSRWTAGLVQPDYFTVDELLVGDSIVQGPYELGTVTEIFGDYSTGSLYDLEVDDVHDYRVDGLGFAHNGGGKRAGSFAIYLEPWHADVEDFLEMKKNTGSEEERARDLFYALWIPDLFMERVDANGEWTLFCPNEAPGLADAVGPAFKALYERYEAEGRGRKTVKAQKLWFQILESQIETGTPYLLYKDAANLKSNQQNLGTIKSSNLCVAPETRITTKEGDIAIKFLCGREVEVWNGEEWSATTVVKTNDDAELWTIVVDDIEVCSAEGTSWKTTKQMDCTPYHKFLLRDGSRVDARELKPGDALLGWTDDAQIEHIPHVRSIRTLGRRDVTYCFNEPRKHAGVFNGILAGNCTEIIEYSSPEETAVCNLASISLPAFVSAGAFDLDKLRAATKIIVRNLNRVIDVNYYPIPEAERSNKRHRPIGLGVQGLADVFAMLNLAWESPEAADLNKRIFAHMYYAALESSADLAEAEGPYETYKGSPASLGKFQPDLWNVDPQVVDASLDWGALRRRIGSVGLRNSLLVAPMPTASTSQILGNCECIEPYATHIFTRRTLAGEFIVLNKHLVRALLERGLWTPALKDAIIGNNGSIVGLPGIPEEIQRVFKTVWEIKQKTLIDMAADRGPYICQSQSLNLFLAEPDYRKLTSMHFYTWRKGLKTGIYYLRTKPAATAQKFTVEPVQTVGASVGGRVDPVDPVEPEECLMCSS
jgi:ribonucleotide reductase alpha subunit